ncbi:MAG TPA: N,N-dimethylformamidase beta subunit family domain-containing protein, partial [Bacteroidota bacterium]|nr:N,N-dimethylformamidase beta subunit family domain-containing protein [Bacteroidota bacterium]
MARWTACVFLVMVSVSYLFPQEAGYVTPLSAEPGDTIHFHLSTKVTPIYVVIYKEGLSRTFVMASGSIPATFQPTPDSAFWYGCGWTSTYDLAIPPNWTSGVYTADFPTSTGNWTVLFIVKERRPGSHSKVLVSFSVNTWEAYNTFGGRSLYPIPVPNTNSAIAPSYKVSFNRPFNYRSGPQPFVSWDSKLISWLDKQGIAYEVATDIDLSKDSSALNPYDLLILVGHDEYWSRAQRNAIQKFVNEGKKLA